MPAAAPMATDPTGPTKPEAGVMATRPATAPVQIPMTVGLPRNIHSTSIQVKPAVAVAMWVTSMAMPACRPADTAEPALKPNQPTHNIEAPMKVNTMLCAGPESLRLPSTRQAIRPATPELTCTTVPPAKSSTLNQPAKSPFSSVLAALKMPSGPQTQCATGEETKIAHRPMNQSIAENFMRSAKAPAISAGVMIAKVSWKQRYTLSGIVGASGLGLPMPFDMSLRIPCRKARSRPPMNGDPLRKAKL